ncbi:MULTISPECIES: multidrug efflux MFS transporter periplasmic adaptor subunit EmrA [Photorhabdus]|uniref:Multidrug efflux MFS transporter periplasmic adaptor subunit EmrA n=2 Tax=Photorhabdus TaxID=29487 RepID=A0ABX0AZE6_9GAMM|nr:MULTISPECIES: multidrug efflux MFS transporter periplasmic adaptor subunit EmrA [Photorhabdus]MCC8375189.1 multidrug efflux MFS transporter periplasmic adaptor subunit EmrA [Photorhabdus bodei]MCC8465733.1 multidrug efflux MFS transporter periplasmic adaptor subunit EmrA [Photorhabdus bodei]MCT8354153.1 multidrug efflux MFS transporter periplasmic adaptor subunit EmrA [Photorhabdus kayaii]MDB6374705.1 multidrug efflux MFS transporter periplasmic adaptor subunit EmrA [Photorhabdus bodei]NDL1
MTGEIQPPPLNEKKSKRKLALILATLLFVFAGLGYFTYWLISLRHYQATDDAYVVGNQVQVMAQITGSVTAIYADNTDFVQQGDILLRLDSIDAEHAFERAKNILANNVRQTHQTIIDNEKLLANIALKQTALQQAQDDLKRREHLGLTGAIAKENLIHSRNSVQVAKSELNIARQQYYANKALVIDTPLNQQPAIKLAASQLCDAWLTLQRTQIVAPVTGYVSRRSVQVGSQIKSGAPLMVIVPADQLWVEANFKEVQLANVRIGQSVTLISDFYGNDVIYRGQIVGLDMGTGSAFSLLPAQNATGNWIKVVQRLPVRVELEAQQLIDHPLRIGLSMHATVDTRNRDGLVLADTPRNRIVYETNILTYNTGEIDQLINEIIQVNTSQNK